MSIEVTRDLLTLVTAACAALAGVASIVSGTIIFGKRILRGVIREEVRPLRDAVDFHLSPNGIEHLLPPEEQGKPLRNLVLLGRLDQHKMAARLTRGAAWMEDHEDDHRERDPSFPRRAHNVRGEA